jgi:dipeptidyl aminopeptidase/acylaminoacyl peptidase
VLAALLAAGCGEGGTGPDEGPDLDALFAPPATSELAAVRAEWAARDPAPADVRVESTQRIMLGSTPATLRVLSHAIEGGRHYGAVITAEGAPPGSLPVLVYLHGGDDGVAVDELLLLTLAFGDAFRGFAWVLPSFRGELLQARGGSWRSGGAASPWDRDVDDAMALLGAALATTPAADPTRVGALGFSRGGGVALLMGIRDERVDRVVEFFGPTDFLGADFRAATERALDGSLPALPGVRVLNERMIQPYAAGTLALAQARLELARRSAVLFAAELPPVLIHHGSADPVVAVSHAESLIGALQRLGRGTPATADEWYLYAGAGHDPLALAGAVARTTRFLAALAGGS